MLNDMLLTVQAVVDPLLLVGLAACTSIAVIVAVFARGLIGWRRVRQQILHRWASLEAHHQVVMGLDAAEAADGEWSSEAIGLDGWAVLQDRVRHAAWDDVPGRVLAHVVRQAWFVAPDVLALEHLARADTWPELARQRRTLHTLLWLGVGGAALVLITAVWSVQPADSGGGVALPSLTPHLAAALAVVLMAVGSALVLRMQAYRAGQSASRLTDELATLACGPWLDAALAAARSRAFVEAGAVRAGVGGDGDPRDSRASACTTARSPNQVDTAAQALLATAHAIDRLRVDLERSHRDAPPSADAPAMDARLVRTAEALERAQQQWSASSDATVMAINRVADQLIEVATRLDAQSEQLETARQTLLAGFSAGFRQTGEKVAAELVPAVQMLARVVGRGEGSVER